jgi:hypothetical protein
MMPTPRRHADPASRQRAYRQRLKAVVSVGPGIPLPAAIRAMPSHPRWKALQDKARAHLASVVCEMESYRDGRSDEWQESDKAIAFEERLDLVREALQAIEAIA